RRRRRQQAAADREEGSQESQDNNEEAKDGKGASGESEEDSAVPEQAGARDAHALDRKRPVDLQRVSTSGAEPGVKRYQIHRPRRGKNTSLLTGRKQRR